MRFNFNADFGGNGLRSWCVPPQACYNWVQTDQIAPASLPTVESNIPHGTLTSLLKRHHQKVEKRQTHAPQDAPFLEIPSDVPFCATKRCLLVLTRCKTCRMQLCTLAGRAFKENYSYPSHLNQPSGTTNYFRRTWILNLGRAWSTKPWS